VYLVSEIGEEMKTAWGRFRPYETIAGLVGNVDGSHFTPWYHLNGDTGHKSFPSGHTREAFMLLWLPFFVDRKNIKLQKIMLWIGIAYGILMAITRVRVGAHWTSDTIGGGILTIVICLIIAKVLDLRTASDHCIGR
ncbi:MAG: phosphatase PAP2 family protein, partial [Elusimicrobiota bacterium]|nr:phosphatase PAP2 family protein [Elusimicrobiota bacterium]